MAEDDRGGPLIVGALQALWAGRRLIAGGLTVAMLISAWLYIGHLADQTEQAKQLVAQMTSALADAERVAAANAQAVDQIKAEAARTIAVIEGERDAALERANRVRAIQKEIDHASSAEDGPVAAVLSRALERLRDGAGAPSSGSADRAAAAAGKPFIVQP